MVVISRRDFSGWGRCFRWRQETNAEVWSEKVHCKFMGSEVLYVAGLESGLS